MIYPANVGKRRGGGGYIYQKIHLNGGVWMAVWMAYWTMMFRVVEEDTIAFNIKEGVLLLFTRNVLDLIKKR